MKKRKNGKQWRGLEDKSQWSLTITVNAVPNSWNYGIKHTSITKIWVHTHSPHFKPVGKNQDFFLLAYSQQSRWGMRRRLNSFANRPQLKMDFHRCWSQSDHRGLSYRGKKDGPQDIYLFHPPIKSHCMYPLCLLYECNKNNDCIIYRFSPGEWNPQTLISSHQKHSFICGAVSCAMHHRMSLKPTNTVESLIQHRGDSPISLWNDIKWLFEEVKKKELLLGHLVYQNTNN